jgi:hypothetical protein
MMKLQQVFTQLTSGELSQLSIGGGESGEINESNYKKVVPHINLGLTALYRRFFLKEGRVNLSFVPGKLIYPIHSNYAVSNTKSSVTDKFLQDTLSPFKDDILKIEGVLTDSGFEIPLNDVLDPLSIITPSPTILRLPTALVSQANSLPESYQTVGLTVVYRANHPQINIDHPLFDIEKEELELPESHLDALLLYVASRVNTPLGMVNEFNAGNNYASKYEMACKQLEANSFQINPGTSNHRLIRNGWV